MLVETEASFRSRSAMGDIEGNPCALRIFIHELGGRSVTGGQESSPDKPEPLSLQVRRLEPGAEAFGEPSDKMILLVGGDFNDMQLFGGEDHMRGHRIISDAQDGTDTLLSPQHPVEIPGR